MSESEDWTLEFYEDARGERSVAAFLSELDDKTRARFRWSLEQLRLRNVNARSPLVRHLEGDLWELREESSGNIYRIIYVFHSGRRIVLLHAFAKKSQRIQSRDLDTARRRYGDFLDRRRGH